MNEEAVEFLVDFIELWKKIPLNPVYQD